MTVDVADVAPADLRAFVGTAQRFWGEPLPPGDDAAVADILDRAHLARLDGAAAGSAAVIDFALTLPGGARVPMAGVTWVSVMPAARRHGLLRALMDHMLVGARDRGAAVLGLCASESSIYRRFGYGVATEVAFTEIDTAHATFREPAHGGGQLRSAVPEDVIAELIAVDEAQHQRTGAIDRSEASWRRAFGPSAHSPTGAGPSQVVLHVDGAGVVDGFVHYRLELRWPEHLADGIVHVLDLSATTGAAHAALWRHVLDLDLIEHVRMERGWVDDPVRHLLADGRRLRQRPLDDLHLRFIDIATVLSERRYAREDCVVLEVVDPTCPDLAGRYRVEGGLDGAAAERTGATPDIVLDAPSLAALVLGDTSASILQAAGLIEEARPGAVRRATAMFTWTPRPWMNHMF